MARIFAWCDAPTAPTGFGKSAKHVLGAFHAAGHEITQLAVNLDTAHIGDIPWRVVAPQNRDGDPYGVHQLQEALRMADPDVVWTTFDPECPFGYQVPGTNATVLQVLQSLRETAPVIKTMGWFPIDGGPLSDLELAQLGMGALTDFPVTMSPHVYDLIKWTFELKGHKPNMDEVRQRLRVIPHGVESDVFTIPTDEERRETRRRYGIKEDVFLIAQVERNQQRKQNYLGLDVMERLLKLRPKLRGCALLYQHMVPNEETQGCRVGYDLPRLAWRYGLQPGRDVAWAPGFVEERQMPDVYRMADAFLSVSTGEGFQYPAWEALACGVPLVLPNCSARAAWLTGVPNVRLYDILDRTLVLRGGYDRRMGMPLPDEAALQLAHLADRGGAKPAHREEGRKFVIETASVSKVQAAWVELLDQALAAVYTERGSRRISVPADPPSTVVEVGAGPASPGLGDLLMMGPALDALRAAGERVVLRVAPDKVPFALLFGLADAVETKPTAPATRALTIVPLWFPKPTAEFADPKLARQMTIARQLGIQDPEVRLKAFRREPPAEAAKGLRATFLDQFGVGLESCAAIAFESGDPRRALPTEYIVQVGDAIKAAGLTPLILGGRALDIRRVGFVDLTGRTDPTQAGLILSQVRVAITADNGPAHMAAAWGTPLVACFTLVDPAARVLGYYAGEIEAMVPPVEELGGERFPAGEQGTKQEAGAWARTYQPAEIARRALKILRILPTPGLRLIRPGGGDGPMREAK